MVSYCLSTDVIISLSLWLLARGLSSVFPCPAALSCSPHPALWARWAKAEIESEADRSA